jgi:thiaminase/transcriptional activator TenA
MTQSLSSEARAAADSIWEAQLRHPFVRGIGDGSVDRGAFAYWVRQDYAFLIDYARLFSLAAARAPDLTALTTLARLAHETLNTEMSLHRAYAAEFGISEAELEAVEKAPATQAYCDFLLRTAALGDFGELVAALLPCMWGFSEIGLALQARGLPSDSLCRQWIEMYASLEFSELAAWCRDLLDSAAAGAGEAARARLVQAFVTSSRYELRFWDMALAQERW